jgi:hypothetical protein
MTIPINEDRCQGRTAGAMGSATLCRDCVDCQRRTDIPAGVTLQWMKPPKMVVRLWPPFNEFCPSHIGPSDDEVIE